MKKMIFGVLAVLLIGAVACNKESVNEGAQIDAIFRADKSAVAIDELPVAITETVETEYFHTYAEEAWKAERHGFEVVLGDGDVLYFDLRGEELQNGQGRYGRLRGKGRPCPGLKIRPDSLLQPIKDYVAANYPEAAIKVGIQRDSHILVLLQPKKILVFDLNGVFIEEAPGFKHCGAVCNEVAVEDLPAAITDYIATNYPAAEIKRVCKNPRGHFIVGTMTPDGPRLLVFDKTGKFLFTRP